MPKPTDSAAGEPTGTAPVTPAVYNEFIAGLDLEGIRLVHAHIDATGLPERRSLRPQLRIDEASYANSEDQVKVLHHLDFSGYYEGSEGPAVNVHARFEVTYSAKERMSDEIFDEFKARNLPINTWPYFREFVHTALARVGWPVLVLPVYKKTNPFFSGAEPEAESAEQDNPV